MLYEVGAHSFWTSKEVMVIPQSQGNFTLNVCVFFLASVNNHGIKAYHIDGREKIHVHI